MSFKITMLNKQKCGRICWRRSSMLPTCDNSPSRSRRMSRKLSSSFSETFVPFRVILRFVTKNANSLSNVERSTTRLSSSTTLTVDEALDFEGTNAAQRVRTFSASTVSPNFTRAADQFPRGIRCPFHRTILLCIALILDPKTASHVRSFGGTPMYSPNAELRYWQRGHQLRAGLIVGHASSGHEFNYSTIVAVTTA